MAQARTVGLCRLPTKKKTQWRILRYRKPDAIFIYTQTHTNTGDLESHPDLFGFVSRVVVDIRLGCVPVFCWVL